MPTRRVNRTGNAVDETTQNPLVPNMFVHFTFFVRPSLWRWWLPLRTWSRTNIRFSAHIHHHNNGNNDETEKQKILSISLRSDLHLITIMYQILWIQSRETISLYFSLSVGTAKRWMLLVEKRKRENSDVPLFVFGYSFC